MTTVWIFCGSPSHQPSAGIRWQPVSCHQVATTKTHRTLRPCALIDILHELSDLRLPSDRQTLSKPVPPSGLPSNEFPAPQVQAACCMYVTGGNSTPCDHSMEIHIPLQCVLSMNSLRPPATPSKKQPGSAVTVRTPPYKCCLAPVRLRREAQDHIR
jgi:hypothetical protein